MNPASTCCTCATPTGTGAGRRSSPSATRRTSTSTRSGRPTARRSPTPTTACSSGASTWPAARSTKVDQHTYLQRRRLRRRLVARQPVARATPRSLDNHLRAAYLCTTRRPARRQQVTDGMSDVRYLAFDKQRQVPVLHGQHRHRADDQRHRHVGHEPAGDPQRLPGRARQGRCRRRWRRRATRRRTKPAGETPKTGRAAKQAEQAEKPSPTKIDLDGIGQRILALPLPARNYVGLQAGKAGIALPARSAGDAAPAGRAGWRRRRHRHASST